MSIKLTVKEQKLKQH